ncbi:hypothetical protein T439DRAFT_383173 [Meredithblackwellia eburnea MCA 4105]
MDNTVAAIQRTLKVLDQVLAEEQYQRPSRVKQGPSTPVIGSCSYCRQLKSKCDGSLDMECSRCRKAGVRCEFQAKGKPGRKAGQTKRGTLLSQARKDLTDALREMDASPGPSALPSVASTSSGTTLQDSPSSSFDGAEDIDPSEVVEMENPLSVLAHLSLAEAAEGASGSGTPSPSNAWVEASASYYSTGLYEQRQDTNDALNPVTLGLLTEQDFHRLWKLYFDHLWPFLWQLDPDIHTPDFLRTTSPFLMTALLATAAQYDPLSSHFMQSLQAHARELSVRVFREGYKSVEIVQGYHILSHWAVPLQSWAMDKGWNWLGQALVMGREIRMDKEFGKEDFFKYQLQTGIRENMYEMMREERARAWRLICCGDIALSAQTGRIVVAGALRVAQAFLPKCPMPPPGDRYYNCSANTYLNHILSIAFDVALEERQHPTVNSRAIFRASWNQRLEDWKEKWGQIDVFLRTRYQNARTLLLATLLWFPGSNKDVLEECAEASFTTVKLANGWSDDSINYSSNFSVTNVAYGAVLLLKLVSLGVPADPAQNAAIRTECEKIVMVLLRIAIARIESGSLASLQAARIQGLLRSLKPLPLVTLPKISPDLVIPSQEPQFSPLSPPTEQPSMDMDHFVINFDGFEGLDLALLDGTFNFNPNAPVPVEGDQDQPHQYFLGDSMGFAAVL